MAQELSVISEYKRDSLFKQGYRLVGNHSAVKVCHWTKKCLRADGVCYKKTFYGVNSNQCVQMSPSLPFCNLRCLWCWRDINHTRREWVGVVDDPKEIIDGCIKAQVEYIQGFGGNPDADAAAFEAAQNPKHFAISLTGEPTLYPRMPELIDELTRRGISSFLVTNGTNTEMVRKLVDHQPTQIYMTLPSPSEEDYNKSCRPLTDGGWQAIMETLSLFPKFKRNCVRLTLVKGENMKNPEGYGKIIAEHQPLFVECKGYVWVGYSRERMEQENVPTHEEIKDFASEVAKHAGYKIVDEKKESHVVLLMKEDFEGRRMDFTDV